MGPKVPGLQTTQATTSLLPGFAFAEPEGQRVQDVEPKSVLYEPGLHGLQLAVELAASTCDEVPGAHGRQDPGDVAPVSAL